MIGNDKKTKKKFFALTSSHHSVMSTKFKCGRCKKELNNSEAAPYTKNTSHGQKGEPSNTCITCAKKKSIARKRSRGDSDSEGEEDKEDLKVSTFEEFIRALNNVKPLEVIHLQMCIDLDTIPEDPERPIPQADELLELLEDILEWRWMYVVT